MQHRKPRMDAKQREARRIEAVRRLAAGEAAAAIAAELGIAPNTVYELGKKAREHGVESLRSVPKSGRPLKLAREHWPRLREMVLRGPRACGFDRDLWTLPMIRQLIVLEFGVDYHDDHLSKFMRRLGMSRQKPAVRARERDEEAVWRFVHEEFPEIEKKPGRTAPRSRSSTKRAS